MKQFSIIACVAMALFICISRAELVIPAPHPYAGLYATWRLKFYGWQEFESYAVPITFLQPDDAYNVLCLGNFSGVPSLEGRGIAYMFPFGGWITSFPHPEHCNIRTHISNCRVAKCAALVHFMTLTDEGTIVGQSDAGWNHCKNCSFLSPPDEDASINFPIVQVEPSNMTLWLADEQQGRLAPNQTAPPFPDVTVTMSMQVGTYEEAAYLYGAITVSFFVPWSFANVVAGIIALIGKQKDNRGFTVVTLVLIVEVLANLGRFIILIDPFFAWGIWPLWASFLLFQTYFYPFTLSSAMLVSLFWAQLIWGKKRLARKSVSALFWVLWAVLSILIIALAYVTWIISIWVRELDQTVDQTGAALGLTIPAIVISFALALFFSVTGSTVVYRLRRGLRLGLGTGKDTRDAALKRMLKYVLAMAVVLILLTVNYLVLPFVSYRPPEGTFLPGLKGWFTTVALGTALILSLSSLIIAFVFPSPDGNGSSTSGSRSSTTKKSDEQRRDLAVSMDGTKSSSTSSLVAQDSMQSDVEISKQWDDKTNNNIIEL